MTDTLLCQVEDYLLYQHHGEEKFYIEKRYGGKKERIMENATAEQAAGRIMRLVRNHLTTA